MKKGLRLFGDYEITLAAPFKRGPDEEGIETAYTGILIWLPFKRGPDEEGIETINPAQFALDRGSNADLMKKGLRREPLRSVIHRATCSNADLMKKGLRRCG